VFQLEVILGGIVDGVLDCSCDVLGSSNGVQEGSQKKKIHV